MTQESKFDLDPLKEQALNHPFIKNDSDFVKEGIIRYIESDDFNKYLEEIYINEPIPQERRGKAVSNKIWDIRNEFKGIEMEVNIELDVQEFFAQIKDEVRGSGEDFWDAVRRKLQAQINKSDGGED